VIIDLDLPLLLVDINDRFLSSSINTNEYIFFRIQLDSGVYPDNIYYSAAILYKFSVVATKEFFFTDFRFKPWDLYDNFDSSDSEISIRVIF